MKIVIDEREPSLYEKCTGLIGEGGKLYSPNNIHISKTTLTIGDIHILTEDGKEVVIIERKTLSDLLSSIKDGRYDEQSHRLIHSSGMHPHNIIYLIEGGVSSLSFEKRKLVHSVITSINHFKGMTVIKTANVLETAEFILSFTDKTMRNFAKKQTPKYCTGMAAPLVVVAAPLPLQNSYIESLNDDDDNDNEETTLEQVSTGPFQTGQIVDAPPDPVTEHNYVSVVKKVKKDNLTPNNIGAVFLSQIPHVSSVIANAIMVKYQYSIYVLIKELEKNPDCLNNIQTEKDGKKRKIGSNVVKNIRLFLLGVKNPDEQPVGAGARDEV
jgi:hypothetical protein